MNYSGVSVFSYKYSSFLFSKRINTRLLVDSNDSQPANDEKVETLRASRLEALGFLTSQTLSFSSKASPLLTKIYR